MDIKFNEPAYQNKTTATEQSSITSFLIRKKIVKNQRQALLLQLLIIGVSLIVLGFKLFSGAPQNDLPQSEAEKAGNKSEIAPN